MIEQFFTYLSSHFMETAILILIGLLFFKEQLTKLVYFRFGLDKKNGENGSKSNGVFVGEVSRLSNYYNHDLTSKLDKIQDTSNDIKILLEEFKEYGIKIRK